MTPAGEAAAWYSCFLRMLGQHVAFLEHNKNKLLDVIEVFL